MAGEGGQPVTLDEAVQQLITLGDAITQLQLANTNLSSEVTELKAKLTVHAAAFTASAREKIEAAGGSCELIN